MKYHTLLMLTSLLLWGFWSQLEAMSLSQDLEVTSNVPYKLHRAVLSGKSDLVKDIVSTIDLDQIDKRDDLENTPLLLAVKQGYQECALILMSYGANVGACDRKGRSVLCLARKKGLLKVIDAMLDGIDSASSRILLDKLAGRMINSHFSSRLLLAFEAVKQNCRNIVLRLLYAGVNQNTSIEDGKTLLHFAATYGSAPLYTLLLSNGAREDQLDKTGKRPIDYGSCEFFRDISVERIHGIVQSGEMAKLEEWMSDRQDLLKEAFGMIHEGMSVLHRAVLSGNEMMLLFVWQHAPRELVDQLDFQANTPFILACKRGFVGAIKLLVAPSNLEICNNEGKDALFYALEHSDITIIDPFLQFCLPADCKEIVQQALLWSATLFPIVSPIQKLWDLATQNHCLGFRAYLSENLRSYFVIQNKSGTTPLHEACAQGNRVLVEMLLPESDIMALDEKKRTPLHIAAIGGHAEIVEMLIREKAEIDAIDCKGRTALHYAALKGWIKVIGLLVHCGYVLHSNLDVVSAQSCSWETRLRQTMTLILKTAPASEVYKSTGFYSQFLRNDACLEGDFLKKHADLQLLLMLYDDQTLLLYDSTGYAYYFTACCSKAHHLDFQDNSCSTPLHYAVRKGHKKAVKILLDGGASLFVADKQKRTVLNWVLNLKDKELFMMLLNRQKTKVSLVFSCMIYKRPPSCKMEEIICGKLRLSSKRRYLIR